MTTSERLQDALEECKRISEVDAGSDDFLYASDRLVRLVERMARKEPEALVALARMVLAGQAVAESD